MSTLESKRFVVITGKGGVGKTTVSAAYAVSLAARGKRVLVAMCNAKERLSVMLGCPSIGPDVIPVGRGIWAVNMSPEKAIEEYGMLVLRSRVLSKTLIDNKYLRAFLRAVPGMQEWSMLGKAWWHTTETRPDGSPKYDAVILDAPATGHGLDMLRVPNVIIEVAPAGLLRRDAERALLLLRDPATSQVVLVTLPEEMPTTETIELARGLRSMQLPIGNVVINGVLPALFSENERAALSAMGPLLSRAPGDAALLAGRNRAIRERIQSESIARLTRELGVPSSVLPLLFREAADPSAIRELADLVEPSPRG